MSSTVSNIDICEIERVEVTVEPWSWAFAAERRDEIDRHFALRQGERPGLWNGRVLLLHRYAINNRVLGGACFETDYASFLAWRQWKFPGAEVYNIFAAAALRAADGAYVVGDMASHTAAAGLIYFPCGTPDPADIGRDGLFDCAGSVSRELMEETGIDIAGLDARPGWLLLRDRGYLALMKRLTARENADELRARIIATLARQAQPEFSDIRIVRGPADLDPHMPRFMVAFLERAWRE